MTAQAKATHLPEGWASDSTLAKHFDVSRGTIWRWTKEGKLPQPIKITEGCTRWRWEDILNQEGVA